MKGFFAFLLVVAALVLTFCRGSCVSADVAIRAAETQGYTDVEVTEHAWFAVGFRGCGSDAARFTVRAKNPAGKVVEIYVCAGWLLKSATIRVP